MADRAPEYQERVTLGNGPSPTVQPIPLTPQPNLPDLSSEGKAISSFGSELSAVAQKMADATQQTKASQAMEGFLQDRAVLQDQYTKDQDYETAPDRFKEDIDTKMRDRLGTISDPEIRARASLEMTRSSITAGEKVRTAQFGRQADANVAALDTFKQTALNEAVTAASPAERTAVIGRYENETRRLMDAGWIDASVAAKRGRDFLGELDQADALALVNKNPAQAKTLLADPVNFPTLDPVKRQSMIIAAEQRNDSNTTSVVTNAAAFHPEAASLTMGRVIQPDHALRIFDNGIVPIESNGDPKAVSPKGALGPSQIMPDTAREVATGLGMKDVAALDDKALQQRLLTDTNLNLKLGRAYWSQMVTRYDGNVTLAAAAYNAGPGRADAWKEKAEAQFGPTPTPAQIASVVDIKETQDYIGKLYGKFGAPMNVSFSSPAAAMQATNAVGAVLTQQASRENHILSVQASTAAATNDPSQILKLGFEADPQAVASYRATQSAAAEKGDAAAAGKLRDLDYAEKISPMIRQAWSTPTAALDTSVKNLEAQLAAPNAYPSMQAVNMVKALKAVQKEQAEKRDSEPVVLGAENGGRFYTLQPLDARAPLDDNFVAGLRNRDAQAKTANRIYGGSGSPFTAEEASSWRERYADATPQERGQILGTLAKGLSADTFAAALPQVVKGEVSPSDRAALTIAAGLYAGDNARPDIAQSIIEGQNAMQAEKRYLPNESANKVAYQTSKDQYLPLAAFNRASRTDPSGPYAALGDAIDARYAYLSAQTKDLSGATNTTRLKQAVDDVTGGVLYHNGAPLIAPVRGMSQRDFDATVWALKDEDLAGAQTTGGKVIDAAYLRGSAKLQARSSGQYYVQVNQNDDNPQYAVTKDGKPFVLDLRNRQKAALMPGQFDNVTPQP